MRPITRLRPSYSTRGLTREQRRALQDVPHDDRPLVVKALRDERVRVAVTAAEDTFWQTICLHFPDGIAGDLQPEIVGTLRHTMQGAVEIWCRNNVPGYEDSNEPTGN